MKNVMIALLMAGGLLVSAGCGNDKPAGGDAKPGASGAAAAGETGVAECDEYIKKYEACMSKVPAAGKPAMETAFKTQRASFKQGASTPEGKTALKGTCKQLIDSLAQNPMCK